MLVAEQRSTAAREGKGQQATTLGAPGLRTPGAGGERGGVVYGGFAKLVSLVGMAPLGLFSPANPSPFCQHKDMCPQLSAEPRYPAIQGINKSAKNREILPNGPCKQMAHLTIL